MLIRSTVTRKWQTEMRLRSLLTIATLKGDKNLIKRVNQCLGVVPSGEITGDCWRLFDALLRTLRETAEGAMTPAERRRAEVISGLWVMCEEAAAKGFKLPDDVAKYYGRKPQAGGLGGKKEVGGAFLRARDFYAPRPGETEDQSRDNAGEQALAAIKHAEEFGIKFTGLGRARK